MDEFVKGAEVVTAGTTGKNSGGINSSGLGSGSALFVISAQPQPAASTLSTVSTVSNSSDIVPPVKYANAPEIFNLPNKQRLISSVSLSVQGIAVSNKTALTLAGSGVSPR